MKLLLDQNISFRVMKYIDTFFECEHVKFLGMAFLLKLQSILSHLSKTYTLGIITNVLKKTVLNVFAALEIEESTFTHFVSVDNISIGK